jgi:cytochrome c556
VTAADATSTVKRAKFEEIAVRRTKAIIKMIRILGGMGGKARYNYEFTASDVDKIAATLRKEIDQLAEKMIAPGRQLDIEFDL